MAFGIPYKGSKSIYAKWVCEALPPGKRLVDLFAGGCAVTDCAIRHYAYKWDSFLINDVFHEPLDLYIQCLKGENPVSYEWITRDAFKEADWPTRLVWSFGYDARTYLYGREIEAVKRDIETWIIAGEKTHYSGVLDNAPLPTLATQSKRYQWWRECITDLPQKDQMRVKRLENISRLENLERPESIDRVECSYLSYDQYTYRDGDVVYCDIPYQGTHCNQYGEQSFDHATFWQWARSQPFDVFVSERTIPDGVDIEILLERDIPNRANQRGTDGYKREFLVRCRGQK